MPGIMVSRIYVYIGSQHDLSLYLGSRNFSPASTVVPLSIEFLGMTAQPYIKTNYPHHEGIWGWQDHADHVILVVRNIRQTIDEYHDILADIDYAKTWEEATEKIPNLYNGYIDMDNYAGWRDE